MARAHELHVGERAGGTAALAPPQCGRASPSTRSAASVQVARQLSFAARTTRRSPRCRPRMPVTALPLPPAWRCSVKATVRHQTRYHTAGAVSLSWSNGAAYRAQLISARPHQVFPHKTVFGAWECAPGSAPRSLHRCAGKNLRVAPGRADPGDRQTASTGSTTRGRT
jgi:hypothetical protein